MPEYSFQHPKTKKVVTVIQRMSEKHIYIDKKGVEWNRIFSIPNSRIDTLSDMNPFSEKEFMDKTKNKKLTVGEMWDLSGELGKKREKKAGKDEVKEKTVQKYEKATKKPHPLK